MSACGGWEPISTAPLDGTVVMGLWFEFDGDGPEGVKRGGPVLWNGDDWVRADGGALEPVEEPDGWRPLGGES